MQLRALGQWICLLAISCTSGVTAVACGSSGNNSVFDGGGQEDSSVEASTDDATVDDGPSFINPDAGDAGCQPATCASLGVNCGMQPDGCGGVIQCGSCTAPAYCGGGGPSVCGTGDSGLPPDGGNPCTPLTCAAQKIGCGPAGDGCGGVLNCGSCTSPQYCGGGGFAQCGGNNGLTPDGGVPCTPKASCTGGQNCGFQGDGCGGVLACGTCTAPQYCGGGGFNICGGNSGLGPDGSTICKAETCASQNINCGPAGDGCGNLLACGTCSGSNTCGGGGVPGQCGNSNCTGLCKQQPSCDGGILTTITGTVVAGTLPMYGSPDPIPNVVVYVPNGTPAAFKPGVQCSQCGAEVTGSPLVSTTTAYDGTFTLTNVPAGSNIPVVIQLGRWRREATFTIPACATTNVGQIRMPRTEGETSAYDNIPLTAISTGSVDAIECVLLKMGVDQSEFTASSGTGRIHLYAGDSGSGVSAPGTGTKNEAALMGSGGTYMNYDQILFPCWGGRYTKTNAELADLVTYANAGGHFFATHYSYSWLFQNNPFNTTAQWNVDYSADNGPDPFTVQLPATNPKGKVFSDWLHYVKAMASPGQTVQISYPRHDVDKVLASSVDWIDGQDPTDSSQMLLHYTFDTPIGSTNQCGHVIFSDFHVTNNTTSPKTKFPTECDSNPMTAQEKILEYMIWDLASCVPGPPPPPNCTPITCQDQKINCGPAGDGCGGQLNCGTCTPPQTCGGGGVPGQCGAPDGGSCTPQTCTQQNINCGPAGDGCGNELMCGTCTPPQTCGGGGVPGQCGYPDGGSCAPETCAQQNIFCGPAGDGCGNEIMCGTCTPPQTCGGGGVPGKCGAPDAGACTPKSCTDLGKQCGQWSDGCGNIVNCPACPSGKTCNSAGQCQGTQ